MANEMDLMQRLAVSKKIMEKTEQIKRGDVVNVNPSVQNFEPVNGTYNLPEELLGENTQKTYHDPTRPLEQDRILNSKLPDEIKRLMIEQPIVQPNTTAGATLSNEVIEGAQRLMKKEGFTEQKQIPKKQVSENINIQPSNSSNISIGDIKSMIRDVVRDTVRDVVREELKDAGMLVESTINTNETIQFKVGNTLFVGKVTKIKNLEK
jgi:hypothetical protein